MFVKPMCCFVFGTDQQGQYAQFGPSSAEHGINQEDTARSVASIAFSYASRASSAAGTTR